MSQPLKLAICGRMRSGKDAVAAHLAQEHGFVRFAFGDGIRKVCRELFPDQLANNTKPRALLQGVGQAMRAFDPDVWVNATMRSVSEINASPRLNNRAEGIVITDLRQPNEYDRLRAEGFVIIRVNAGNGTRYLRMINEGDAFTAADLEHETERYIDTFAVDYEIENNGSLAELHAQVDAVMAEIMREKEAAE